MSQFEVGNRSCCRHAERCDMSSSIDLLMGDRFADVDRF